MTDWYIILFLAAGLIIFSLNTVAEHRSPYEFLMIGERFGIKQGVILIWICFFGGYSILIPIYLVFHFGLLISIGYYLCLFIFIYVLMSTLFNQFQTKGVQEPILRNLYERKFTANGFRWFLPLLIFANLDGLLLQLTLANKLFNIWFPQQSILFVALLLIFCVVIAGLGGMFTIYRAVYILLIICGFSLLIVPLFLYLKDGIHPVFQSYLAFEKLHNSQFEGVVLVAIPVAFIGWLLTNIFLMQVLQSLKGKYYKPSLKLSLFCSASIPTSVLIYGIYIMSKQIPDTYFVFIRDLLPVPSQMITLMILFVWLSSVVHSIVISLFSMSALMLHSFPNGWQPSKKIRLMYFRIITLSLFVFISQLWLVKYLNILLIGYFLFYLTISFPLAVLIKRVRKSSSWPSCFLIMFWVLGIIICIKSHSPFLAIKVLLLLSIIFSVGLKLFDYLKIDNILQK